jgi:hypothetical protein
MNRESLPFGNRIQVATQLRLVLGIGSREQLRAHPFLEDQPVAQVDALDHEVLRPGFLADGMHIPVPGQQEQQTKGTTATENDLLETPLDLLSCETVNDLQLGPWDV